MAAGREGRRFGRDEDHVGRRGAGQVGQDVTGVGVGESPVIERALRRLEELQLGWRGRRGARSARGSGSGGGTAYRREVHGGVAAGAGGKRARRAPLLHRQHRKRHIRGSTPGRQVDTVGEVTRVLARGVGRQRQRVGLARCGIRADGHREPAAGRGVLPPGIAAAGLRSDPVVGQGRADTARRVDLNRGVAGIREAARQDDPGARGRHDRLPEVCLCRIRERCVVRLRA